MRLTFRRCILLICLWAVAGLPAAADDKVSFNRDIRPILSDRCFQCHGPDEEARQGELRLDLADAPEGPLRERDGHRAIQPGNLAGSALWFRLTEADEAERMPPPEARKKPLSEEEKSLIKRWILQGAEFDDFWAFVPPRTHEAPHVKNQDWPARRIDRFVLASLEQKNLQPQPRADRRTLIRRVTLDLTGLPPTLDEIRVFLDDPSPDAYEKLVDRLMATNRYGEHMAKYWLDLVRFADTNGIHHDHYREMTPYRDWVIRAFNENLRFDDFMTYQLAGDLYPNPTLDQQIASGFNRLHLVIDRGTALPEESYTRNVVDRVSAFGTAFLGLTLGCAVCHDHKYDPVTQKEFYQLYAFFNNIDAAPETPGKGTHAPFIRLPSAEQGRRLKSLESRLATLAAEIAELKKTINQAKPNADGNSREATVPAARTAARTDADNQLKRKLGEQKKLSDENQKLTQDIPVTLVSRERADVRPAYVLIRGAYDRPGEQVERNTPDFLPPLNAAGPLKTRMDLARWLTDKQHPLSARVAVNRFWQQFFGVGLVKTSEDFGAQGEFPSHADLLDDLASQFVRSQWDVKALVRSMVLSQTYQQASSAPPDAFQADPENRWLARGARFRLDSEALRDQILAISGLLDETMYGKSVKPPQPPNLWKSVSMVSSSTYAFKADTGAKIYRRSVYSFWKRAMPQPQMTIFDAPTRESCVARRERTNTPVQALVLMNEGQYFLAAQRFARGLLNRPDMAQDDRLSAAYESVTSHLPDDAELTSLGNGLDGLREIYQQDTASALAMTTEMDKATEQERIEVAAYTMLMNSLFNLDVAKTRE